MARYWRTLTHLVCAITLAWNLWDREPHGDDPYDNIDLRTAWSVAWRLWMVE